MTSAARERLKASRPAARATAARDTGVRVEWSLEPGDTAAVPLIRRRIMTALRRAAPQDADLWSAELVVAELLSNAVTHTDGPAFVSLRWDGEHPLLSVADRGPGFAGRGDAAGPLDPLAEGGRGLFLVARLALDVEVAVSSAGGSQVCVTLDVNRVPEQRDRTAD